MKLARRFKFITVAGIYLPAGALNGLAGARGVAFYREGSRRWDTPAIRRAEKRGRRTGTLRLALREANG